MDTFRNQFLTDLSYFNYDKKIKKVKDLEKITNLIKTYNIDKIYDEESYLTCNNNPNNPNSQTINDNWLDMGSYPSFNNSYEDIFNEDESKYIIYLFLWVIKINLSSVLSKGNSIKLFITEENGDDEYIIGIDTNILKEFYNKVNDYFIIMCILHNLFNNLFNHSIVY